MTLNEALIVLANKLKLKANEEFYDSVANITKKLNSTYYDVDGDTKSHCLLVGSVGRKTATKNVSDIDMIFTLPGDVYKKYDSYESNGQSALLQEVKGIIKERYPNTDIRGDGQVVVISFSKYIVELVPAFEQNNYSFKYPDSNQGGKWKITNPIPEQKACKDTGEHHSHYFDLCRLIRLWKNHEGFSFKGLLIDTLVHDYLVNKENVSNSLLDQLVGLFEYLSLQNRKQSYWYALGSNQQITNDDNGRFVSKAKAVVNELRECYDDNDYHNHFYRLFGKEYPIEDEEHLKEKYQLKVNCYNDTEEFIENLVSVDIRYDLEIDCSVDINGFRQFLLSDFLKRKLGYLKIKRDLNFYIVTTNCPTPYEIWWKVKNVGPQAIARNEIRGQILKTNEKKHYEKTKFYGPHFVECYLIKQGVCVARAKINVPIGNKE